MRLANGIIIDKEKTFGVLKFSALRREVHIQNEDGTVSEEIKERTYDLKCKEQGRMIQVSIPASVPLKEFDYNTEVEIINPVADTVAIWKSSLDRRNQGEIHGRSGKAESRESVGNGLGLRQNPIPHTGRSARC